MPMPIRANHPQSGKRTPGVRRARLYDSYSCVPFSKRPFKSRSGTAKETTISRPRYRNGPRLFFEDDSDDSREIQLSSCSIHVQELRRTQHRLAEVSERSPFGGRLYRSFASLPGQMRCPLLRQCIHFARGLLNFLRRGRSRHSTKIERANLLLPVASK